MRLDGKVTVITGGTSGIGEACARLLSRKGATVVILGRNESRGKTLEKEILSEGFLAKFLSCDVTKEEQIKETKAKIIHKFHQVDILFNNAGVLPSSVDIEKIEDSQWCDVMNINVKGCVIMCKHFFDELKRQKGVIVNNASIAGMHSYAAGKSFAYSSSKAAVIQFTRLMAKNYAMDGVRVNSISPGIIKTFMLNGRNHNDYIDRVPLKRLGEVDEVAQAVFFLVSPLSSYITGVNIPIDGGVSI